MADDGADARIQVRALMFLGIIDSMAARPITTARSYGEETADGRRIRLRH